MPDEPVLRARPGRPATQSPREASERKRRPMSTPTQRMWVPDIPGFHMHWINDYPGRIEQAIAAGYNYVDPSEVSLNDHLTPVNSDLGARVSMLVGRSDAGTALRAYLMKIKSEFYEEDQAALEARNAKVDEAIRRGKLRTGNTGDPRDANTEYVDQDRTNFRTNLRRSL